MRWILLIFFYTISIPATVAQTRQRAQAWGIHPGVLSRGFYNAITDVSGVSVGHVTLVKGDSIRTGVTAILPHRGNLFQHKVPAAIYIGNGFGKLAGISQVKELGTLESPIILTNTLNVATGMQAVITYTLQQPGNEQVQSVNAVVGETNDGYLNDIRGRHVTEANVLQAITKAESGKVAEGNIGAGTGTVCFGFKGGIGTASRKLPASAGGYTVGVLVQSNFGGVLQIDGIPAGKLLDKYYMRDQLNENADGSCMMVVATDAPLDARNLERLAKRAFMGLAKTGGIASNGSGDYVIAFSTHKLHQDANATTNVLLLNNESMSPLFMAAIEATEEAILNSLFMAETMQGKGGRIVEALPVQKILSLVKKQQQKK